MYPKAFTVHPKKNTLSLVTSDDLDLTEDHQRLTMVLGNIHNAILAVT